MTRTYRLIWQILTPQERRHYLWLFLGSILTALLEVAGVAVILPFLRLVSDPAYLHADPNVAWFRTTLGLADDRAVIVTAGVLVFAVIACGMGLRALASYAEIRFGLMRAFSIGRRLLAGYLRQPYGFFLIRNSADIGQNLLTEIDLVIRESVLPAVLLVSQAMVTLMIAGFLFVVQPWVAVGASLVLVSVYIGVYRALRGVLGRIGVRRFAANRDRFHVVGQALGGIKEVKVMGLEDQFLTRFATPALTMAQQQTLGLVIGRLPRFALETVLYGGFILMALVMVATNPSGMTTALPTFGLIGMAGMKLFPALQSIYANLSLMRYSTEALEKLHHAVTALPPAAPQMPDLPPLRLERELVLRGLTFRYEGAEKPALSGLDMMIPARSTIGIVGGTGAGKTTLIDLILGLLRPDAGVIEVDGLPVTPDRLRAWQKSLGYVPQSIFLSDDTVAANVAFGVPPDRIDMAAVQQAARIANLHDFVLTQLPQGYATTVGERGVRLSGGQRQRIGIARALYHNPDVLILDEATSALDNLTERAVMEAVHNLGHAKTVIMIAHRLGTVRDCDCIFLLNAGRVEASGSYSELLAGSATFRRLAQA